MRRAAKVDTTQAAIVAALRRVGCSVQPLHQVGQGVPDLVVGRAGINYLIEAKTPGGKLTPDERRWHELWGGQVAIAATIEEALAAVGIGTQAPA